MTRLLIISDVHLERHPAWSLPKTFPPFDVAVFAGDIDSSPEFAVLRLAAAQGLAGRPIVLVVGNHEFYGGPIEDCLAAGRAACAGTRVHLLDRDVVVLSGVRFAGATLWTDYRLHGDATSAMSACRRKLPDHRRIEVGEPGSRRLFQPRDAAARHESDRAFIEAELARPFNGPTVVVTHHAPHPGSLQRRFAGDRTAPGYASDLGIMIQRAQPQLWIHGHVHHSVDHRVGATRVIANPRGYDRCVGSAENPAFDPGLVIEVLDEGGFDTFGIAALAVDTPPVTYKVRFWTMLRVRNGGDHHILGYRLENGRGRTSSPIRNFDLATMTAMSSTGNRYVLIGDAADEGLDNELVQAWLSLHGLSRHDVEISGFDP